MNDKKSKARPFDGAYPVLEEGQEKIKIKKVRRCITGEELIKMKSPVQTGVSGSNQHGSFPPGAYPVLKEGQEKIIIKKVRRCITDEQLTSDLAKTAREAGRSTISTREYDRLGRYDSATLSKRFGSWHKAQLKAGLAPVRFTNPQKEPALENLLMLWNRLGRQPLMRDITHKTSDYTRHNYIKLFGSWLGTLEALEVYLNSRLNRYKDVYPQPEFLHNTLPYNGSYLYLRMRVRMPEGFKCAACGKKPRKFERKKEGAILFFESDMTIDEIPNAAARIPEALCAICAIKSKRSLEPLTPKPGGMEVVKQAS